MSRISDRFGLSLSLPRGWYEFATVRITGIKAGKDLKHNMKVAKAAQKAVRAAGFRCKCDARIFGFITAEFDIIVPKARTKELQDLWKRIRPELAAMK